MAEVSLFRLLLFLLLLLLLLVLLPSPLSPPPLLLLVLITELHTKYFYNVLALFLFLYTSL
jgi:hypothetical protein